MKRYKFLRLANGKIKSESGNQTWEIGKWKKHRGLVSLCNSGFHCSITPYQAFSYVQGEILAEVEVKGRSDIQDDKESWSEMRIVQAWKWQKQDSVALSIYAAELVIGNYEKEYPNDSRPRDAIKAAKRWLKNPTQKNIDAARSAWSAARSAESAARSAESAAWSAGSAAWSAGSAAWSAARSAESAAWSAGSAARSAGSAARSAGSAGSALIKKISTWFMRRINKLESL